MMVGDVRFERTALRSQSGCSGLAELIAEDGAHDGDRTRLGRSTICCRHQTATCAEPLGAGRSRTYTGASGARDGRATGTRSLFLRLRAASFTVKAFAPWSWYPITVSIRVRPVIDRVL